MLWFGGAGSVIAATFAAESMVREIFFISIEKITLPIKGVTEPFTAALISDLHYGGYYSPCGSLAKKIKSLNPDFVAIAGDTLSSLKGMDRFTEFLKGLTMPAFVVPGNWESFLNWADNEQKKFYNSFGVEYLLNKNTFLNLGGGVNLCGVDDPFTGRDDLSKSLKGVNEKRPSILMAHAPLVANEAAFYNVDATLAGHTHGGQIRIPFKGPLFLPPGCGGYDMGLYNAGGMPLYVTRGIGTCIVPVRLLCPPEITLITFTGG